MIATPQEYDKANQELSQLEKWLAHLQEVSPIPAKGLTKAGVRKMIARLHEELGVYEGTREMHEVRNEFQPL